MGRAAALLLVALVTTLAVGACSGDDRGVTASPTPSPTASPVASRTPPPIVDATVTFDGERCAYAGPRVVPDGTSLRIDYVVAAGDAAAMSMLVAPVATPVTGEEAAWVAEGEPATGSARLSDLLKATNTRVQDGSGSYVVGPLMWDEDGIVIDQAGYFVGCFPRPAHDQLPEWADEVLAGPVWPAALIDVLEP